MDYMDLAKYSYIRTFQSIINIFQSGKFILKKFFEKEMGNSCCHDYNELEWKRSGYKLSELDIVDKGTFYIIYNPDGVVLDIVYKLESSDILRSKLRYKTHSDINVLR